MPHLKYSLAVLLIIFNSGCTQAIVNNKDSNTTVTIEDKTGVIERSKNAAINRSFNIQSGDSAKTIFERLGSVDGNIYILENGTEFFSKFNVNNIENSDALKKFFLANDYLMNYSTIENSNYIKVSLYPDVSAIEKRFKNTEVAINGTVPIGDTVDMLCHKAETTCIWEDKFASNIALTSKTFNYQGNALDAINHIMNSTELTATFKENKIFISYFKTETMSLDIFLRDRESKTDITIQMKSSDDSTSTTGSGGSSLESSTAKDLSVKYKTALVQELQSALEKILTKDGSFTFLPTSGQILIKDKGENVKLAQKLISDFNSKFKDTIEVKLTFYKISREKGDTRGLDFNALGSRLNFTASNMISTAFAKNTNSNMFGLGYEKGNDSAILNFLREHGDAEILNPISFETQSNVLKTVKIANNYGYISSIKTTTDTTNGTTASVTPSSVADGGFVSAIAKAIDNETIAIDLYTTTTSLSRFNSVTAFGNTVQTPDTAEQSIDGYHRVKVGVPYILVSHKYEESKNNGSGLPIEALDSLGYKSDSSKDTYIVIALEAKIRK